jgi:hypothetical protein
MSRTPTSISAGVAGTKCHSCPLTYEHLKCCLIGLAESKIGGRCLLDGGRLAGELVSHWVAEVSHPRRMVSKAIAFPAAVVLKLGIA